MKADNKIIVVTGSKGQGKTTLVNELVERSQRRKVIVLDVKKHDYPTLPKIESMLSLIDFIDEHQDDSYKVRYLPNHKSEFANFVGVVMRVENSLIVYEEAALLMDSVSMPEEIHDTVIDGRHQEQDMIFISPRALLIPTVIRNSYDDWYSFKMKSVTDIKEVNNLEGTEINLRLLKKFQYYDFTESKLKIVTPRKD